MIELLAVIVILAIILLIATPIILNIIDDVNLGAFKSSAKGYAKTAEINYMKNILKGIDNDLIYQYVDGVAVSDDMDYNGETPKNGTIMVINGEVLLAIHNGKYCITKDQTKDFLVENKDIDNCKISGMEVKPEAVITMMPNQELYPTTEIAFSYESSIAYDGKTIIDAEWENKLLTYPIGSHTVRLRVKDSSDIWSDWNEITFEIIEPLYKQYFIFELYGAVAAANCVGINEIEFLDSAGNIIPILLNPTNAVYDSVRNGNPHYWDHITWTKANLNDGHKSYQEGRAALFLYNSAVTDNTFAKFVMILDNPNDIDRIDKIVVNLKTYPNRMPKYVNLYVADTYTMNDLKVKGETSNLIYHSGVYNEVLPSAPTDYILQR